MDIRNVFNEVYFGQDFKTVTIKGINSKEHWLRTSRKM